MSHPWIERLGLEPHPEGGFYRETWRDDASTAIHFLLPPGTFSAWHRVRDAVELWHHYDGGPLRLHLLDAGGYRSVDLGLEGFQAVVPADTWQAAEPLGTDAALCGCTVAPPFRFEAFELADASALAARYPEHRAVITRLCR